MQYKIKVKSDKWSYNQNGKFVFRTSEVEAKEILETLQFDVPEPGKFLEVDQEIEIYITLKPK